MVALRSYDDPCGIARALDRIGERWALLVVRELLLGPKRFTDLRTGLPAASPNVLSQRLRELEASGVVQRRQLPPPASATVYELTAWGQELRPVILALARWGSRAVPVPDGDLSVDALMIALETTFDAAAATGLGARVELRLGAERFCLRVARRTIEITRGSCDSFDAAITTDVAGLRQLTFGKRDLARAMRAGDAQIDGDAAIAARVLALFPRPAPAR
jgi:DNA-binding HxlR family transcriptional regulator